MSTEKSHNERTQHWQQHLDAWQLSSASRAQYCRENDLSYYVFNYWHAKLVSPKSSKNLVPVTVSPSSVATATGTLQLELPNGMQVCGITADSVELVGQLISQL